MKVTVIGCDGAYPRVNGATSSYLIEDKNTKVLLDCGSGCISKIQEHINLKDLNAIVISHYHRDHFADLECMQFATMIDIFNSKRIEKLFIYGPGKEKMLTYKSFCIGKDFKIKESFTIGTLKFYTKLNKHGIECYSIKVINEEGKSLVYTADTEYYKELPVFCDKVNLLIAEASAYESERGKIKGHMTAMEAAKVAKMSNVDVLLLTHLPHIGDIKQLAKEAKTIFHKKVILAKCHLEIEI